MLRRLSAEESIRTANQIAVGTGSLEKGDRRSLVDTWSREANGNQRPRRADPRALGTMGIGVRRVAKPVTEGHV